MASQSPDASRNAVNATRAVVTLIAEPRTAPVSARPSFLSTATTPKQAADSSGRVICHGRIPPRRPPIESKIVPSTMTTVPARIGAVTRSPSSRMATPVAKSGCRLMRAAAIEAPTFSMLTNLRSRPATVPMRPARTKKAIPVADRRPNPPVRSTAAQRPTVPTTRLIQNPV